MKIARKRRGFILIPPYLFSMEATQAQTDERRKFPRFSDRILAGAQVHLVPVPPFYGEPASGYLVDLSGGGMALLMSDLIPKNVFLKMTMTLPDGFQISSVITVRRIVRQGDHNDFLHGIEFLNPAPEMVERIESMAQDILACNHRTQQGEKEICVSTCSLTGICKRPQRIIKDVSPALIEFTQALKKPADQKSSEVNPHSETATAEELEKFWSEAA